MASTEDLFVEANVDPPPAIDAETLAAYLHQHAKTAAQRAAALEAKLRAEEAAEAAAIAETALLQAELAQYNGWLNQEIEGGAAYCISKAVHDERELRKDMEIEVVNLRGRLSGLSKDLQDLTRQSRTETVEQQQVRAADEALSALEKLRRINEQANAAMNSDHQDHHSLLPHSTATAATGGTGR